MDIDLLKIVNLLYSGWQKAAASMMESAAYFLLFYVSISF